MKELVIVPLGTVSPYCKGNKNCPGFMIYYNGHRYLFDCGNGITRLMNFPDELENLNIFITHLHPDHYGDFSSIAQALLVYKRFGYINKNIDVYVPNHDTRTENIHIDTSDDPDDWGYTRTLVKPTLDYEYIKEFEKIAPINVIGYDCIHYKKDDLTIKSLYVPHQISAYAFRIDTSVGSIVYSGDTGSNNNLRKFAEGCDLFICESTFLKGQCRVADTHLFAHEAAMIARDANVKELLLTHFWPEIDPQEYVNEAKEFFPNTSAAYEGKKLVLRR